MSPGADIAALRARIAALAAGDDPSRHRYTLGVPPLPQGWYRRLRWGVARMLIAMERLGLKPPAPWLPALRHADGADRARPWLIWAEGIDRDTLRAACRGFQSLQASLPGRAPVLVTDVPDFAFYSRLGWLVEFLPELSGEGESYRRRKAAFLARLYGNAPALPATVGLEMDARLPEVREWVLNHDR
jgi:hypothetical protein